MQTKVCELHMEGLDARWHFRASEQSPETLIAFVELVPAFESVPTIRSIEFAMSRRDCEAVRDYIDEHIVALRKNPAHTSELLMTYDLGYQLRAGEGEIRGADDGEFAITFLVNVGASPSGPRVYLGGAAVVSASSAAQFSANVQQI